MPEITDLSGYEHGTFLQVIDGALVMGHPKIALPFPCTDRLTPIAETVSNIYSDVIPFDFFCQKIIGYLTNPAASGTFQIDVKKNGVSVFTTKVTIDAGEKSSVTAVTASVLSIQNWSEGNEITIAVTDKADGTASGLSVKLVGYQVPPVGADLTAPGTVAGLSAEMESDTEINVSWSAASDNIAVTGYTLQRALNSGFSSGVTNIVLGNVTSYANTGLTADTTYYYRIKARDAAGNFSASYSSTANATTDEAPFVPFYDTVHANHEEINPTNALKVITGGESGYTTKAITLAVNGYVEWIWSMNGNWDFIVGRAAIAENNGGGYGVWYDDGSFAREVTFTPTVGDVFRIKRISGNNAEVYRNGVLQFTSTSGDFNESTSLQVRTYTTSVNQELAKPTFG